MLTGRLGDRLDSWLAAAGEHPALAPFANGIRQDYQAVRNALTLEWNSGRVEGLNTRTKMLERQMYGRAILPAPAQAHPGQLKHQHRYRPEICARAAMGSRILHDDSGRRGGRADPPTPGELTAATRREREVLTLVCAGHTNAEIARNLFIPTKTVDHHVSAVLGKMGVATREGSRRPGRQARPGRS